MKTQKVQGQKAITLTIKHDGNSIGWLAVYPALVNQNENTPPQAAGEQVHPVSHIDQYVAANKGQLNVSCARRHQL